MRGVLRVLLVVVAASMVGGCRVNADTQRVGLDSWIVDLGAVDLDWFDLGVQSWSEPEIAVSRDDRLAVNQVAGRIVVTQDVKQYSSVALAESQLGHSGNLMANFHTDTEVMPADAAELAPVIDTADSEVFWCGVGDPDTDCDTWYWEGRFKSTLFTVIVQTDSHLEASSFVHSVRDLVAASGG